MKRTICIIGILAIVLNLFGCGLVYIPGTSETEKKRIEESAVGGDSKSVGWSLTYIGRATTRGDKHCHSGHSGNKEN